MKNRKQHIIAATAMFIALAGSGFALDLRQYEGYLSGNRGKAASQTQTQSNRNTVNNSVNYQPQNISPYNTPIQVQDGYSQTSENADAYYVTSQSNQFVPLGNNQKDGERYLVPNDTRVPKELRPLLTEQRTPRQGLALNGGTGATLVPSPGVLEPNKTAIGVHIQPFDLYNINNTKYDDQDYYDINLSAAWGIQDGFEIGFDKSFANQDHYDLEEPLYVNLKYQATGNVTLGGSINCNSGYHSAWVAAGVPVIWVGVGTNFGVSDYEHRYVNPEKFRRAKYGGYNYDYNKGTGYADKFFFLVGGLIPLNNNLRFVYDFNGDRFSLGFRYNYSDSLYINASYISNGDYENLPGAVAQRQNRNFVAGATVAF